MVSGLREVTFEELREKEVINLKDCRRLGFICDIKIDIECGKILSFTVKNCCLIPSKCEEVCVPWENVTKIGDDIIFVDISCSYPHVHEQDFGKKKFFCK